MLARPRLRRWLTLGMALSTVLLIGACGSDDGGAGSSGGDSFNEADISFLQEMTVHHQSAIERAELVEGRTETPELIEHAGKIIESQTAEIEEIASMLEDAGEDASGGEHGMDMGGSSAEMDAEEMGALEAASGEEFDIMFSEMMIEHHKSAVEMSNEVLESGENEEVASLAEWIIEEQEKEIADMEAWLEEWQS